MSWWIERACKACGAVHNIVAGFYSTGRDWADGRMPVCIECKKVEVSENRDAKRVTIKQQQRRRYRTDPEYRARQLANNAHYRATVAGKKAQKRARIAWKITHPEQHAEIQRRWSARSAARVKAQKSATTLPKDTEAASSVARAR